MNGVKLEVKDLRMYDYEKIVGTVGATFPTKFSISNKPTVKNQGDIGACLACTLASVAEQIWHKEMSEGFNYGEFRDDIDKSPGLYLTKALKYATNVGFVPYEEFGVLQEMPEIRKLTKKYPELLEIAKKHRISGYADLSTGKKTKMDGLIKDALTRNGVGLVAVSDDYFGECHAITLTGWDDEQDAYEFQNSWGKDFGVNGIGYIPKDEINDVCAVFVEPIKLPFEDVSESAWYYNDVKNQYLAGYINGTSASTFEPDRPLTRAEFAAINNRTCKAEDTNNARIFKFINDLVNRVSVLEETIKELRRR